MIDNQRMWFVKWWFDYITLHPKEAGEERKRFIDALMGRAAHYPFSAKEYLKSKGEPCSR